MDPIVIKTQARESEPITFHIDDDAFTFTPPKLAGLLLAIVDDADPMEMTRQLLNGWVFAGLPEPERAKLKSRVSDPADPLDMPDLISLIEGLIEVVVGRPTPSPSD